MPGKTPKPPFTPHTLGERVAHARRLLGVREGRDILGPDLAELVGVAVNSVYAWEADTVPGRENLRRLAEVLGVTPEWIHYGVGPGVTAGNAAVHVDQTFADAELAEATRIVAERAHEAATPPRRRKRGNGR